MKIIKKFFLKFDVRANFEVVEYKSFAQRVSPGILPPSPLLSRSLLQQTTVGKNHSLGGKHYPDQLKFFQIWPLTPSPLMLQAYSNLAGMSRCIQIWPLICIPTNAINWLLNCKSVIPGSDFGNRCFAINLINWFGTVYSVNAKVAEKRTSSIKTRTKSRRILWLIN